MPLAWVKDEAQPKAPDPTVPTLKIYDRVPPLRTHIHKGMAPADAMFAEEPTYDSKRVMFQKQLWSSQDAMLRGRDRQVEENVRMLAGQQWSIWNERLARYVDLSRYITDEEKRWRQLPVMNRLLLWFMLLHARMNENPPIIAFQPATSDRVDAELAEVMETVWKTLWQEIGMNEVIDDLTSWMIPGGTAYLKNSIDPEAGDLRPLVAPGVLRLLDANGDPIMGPDNLPVEKYVDKAPYGKDGQPLAFTMDTNGKLLIPSPSMHPEGAIATVALSPLEVRSESGPTKFRRKTWHMHRTYCTPEQAYRNFGVELDPEILGGEAEQLAELQRIQFGSGYYGQAGGREEVSGVSNPAKEGFIELFEGWYAPCSMPGMERNEESAGGRLLITTREKVLRDGPRYAAFPNTSPIHRFDFVNMPGRPGGTTPQEMMNGPARSRNRLFGQVFQHTDKVANPIMLVDKSTGLGVGDVPNRPGAQVFGTFNGANGDPIRYTQPPALGQEVWRLITLLTQEMDDLGNVPGGEGRSPSVDPSGELVRELRYNADRFVAPTMKRMVIGVARLTEDWKVMIPLIWDEEKLLRVGGDESVAQTIAVLPEIFEEGRVNVVPDLESMLPEGRGEKEARYTGWYDKGLLGPPGTPEASQLFFDLSHYPHMNREALPGGIDRSTALEENGVIMHTMQMPPVLEWYDHNVHLMTHYRFMKTRRYLKLEPAIQEMFVAHCEEHKAVLANQQMQQLAQAAAAANPELALPRNRKVAFERDPSGKVTGANIQDQLAAFAGGNPQPPATA